MATALPTGHWGNLTEDQQRKLEAFQAKVGTENAKKQSVHAHLRFLRARNFDVDASSEMYTNFVNWRAKANIDRILDAPPPKHEIYKQLVPHCYHGFDKEGRPVIWERVGKVDWELVSKAMTDEELMLNHIYELELQARRCRDHSAKTGKHVETFTRICDVSGLGMSSTKGLRFIQMMAANDQNYYPERLGKVIVINAPTLVSFFWKMARRWLNPVTAEKVKFCTKGKPLQSLLQILEEDNIPQEFGGKCTGGCRPESKSAGPCLIPYGTEAIRKQLKYRDDPFDSIKHLDLAVSAGKHAQIRLYSSNARTKFDWNFKCVGHEVHFAVDLFEPETPEAAVAMPTAPAPTAAAPSPAAKDEKGGEDGDVAPVRSVVPLAERVTIVSGAPKLAEIPADLPKYKRTELVPMSKTKHGSGTYTCTTPGAVLMVRFDNSSSWLSTKKMRYLVTADEIYDESAAAVEDTKEAAEEIASASA